MSRERLFFDVIYDSEDDSYYAEIYNRRGETVEDAISQKNINSVKRKVLQLYPDAMFIKLIV